MSIGRCAKHQQKRNRESHIAKHQRLYDRHWRKIRAAWLAEHPWCEECLRESCYTIATQVDHIEPHRGDREKFLRGPFQSLCKPHHDAKTAREVGFIPPVKKSFE